LLRWFKDGELLLEQDDTNIDQSNAFSSTLIFHKIRQLHSGLYTW